MGVAVVRSSRLPGLVIGLGLDWVVKRCNVGARSASFGSSSFASKPVSSGVIVGALSVVDADVFAGEPVGEAWVVDDLVEACSA